jgi:hypothetical protein
MRFLTQASDDKVCWLKDSEIRNDQKEPNVSPIMVKSQKKAEKVRIRIGTFWTNTGILV